MYNLQASDLNRRNISFGLLRVYKDLYQRTGLNRYSGPRTVLMIMGCQRSGTSLTYWVFERDFNTRIFREASILSSEDTEEGLRLNPIDQVNQELSKRQVPIVVLKPLVESQRATELLGAIPHSKILWLYRHYQDVASSNLKAFGMDNGIKDLRPFVNRDPDNWRSQNASEETLATIDRFFAEDMNPYDAAALFWYARNQLFFDQGLDQNPDVILCRYEDFVLNPAATMQRIYGAIGAAYPGDEIVQDVHPQSVGKGRKSHLSPEVEAICQALLDRLDLVNQVALETSPITTASTAGVTAHE
ncbi:MAG: sulfotransferase domain-containing protein [Chloroflexota bacterium]